MTRWVDNSTILLNAWHDASGRRRASSKSEHLGSAARFHAPWAIITMRIDPGRKRDFILANTRLIAPPLTPEIRLWLADEAVPLWQKTEEELGAMGLPPPFWAFAWAGGQALARYVLDNPALVRAKRALDFASGSGLVAIAAASSGASAVEASDIDPFAVAAIEANAAENGVWVAPRLENLIGADEGWEVVLAGDVAYQRDLAEAAAEWLKRLARRGRPS